MLTVSRRMVWCRKICPTAINRAAWDQRREARKHYSKLKEKRVKDSFNNKDVNMWADKRRHYCFYVVFSCLLMPFWLKSCSIYKSFVAANNFTMLLSQAMAQKQCFCRNFLRNCKTLLTSVLCVHYEQINKDSTKIKSDWRMAMNSQQFQLRMQMCSQLKETGDP